jgi:two-component system chemotaxis sensor kinase CheA
MSGLFGEMTPEERQGLIAEFLSEGGSYLQNLNQKLLASEAAAKEGRSVSDDTMHEMFRMAHNIKGMASFIGLAETAALTHEMENILQKLRSRDVALTPGVIDALFKAFDFLDEQFKNLQTSGVEKGSAAPAIEAIRKLAGSAAGAPPVVINSLAPSAAQPQPADAPAQPAPAAPPEEEEDSINQKYLDKFIEDSDANIDKFNDLLLKFEGNNQNPNAVNELFRFTHTLKGSAGLIGAKRVARVAHSMENILSFLREKKSVPPENVISLLFSAIDVIKDIVSMYRKEGRSATDVTPICNMLDGVYAELSGGDAGKLSPAASAAQSAGPRAAVTPSMLSAELRTQATQAAASGMKLYQLSMEIEENIPMKSLKVMIAQERIKKIGQFITLQPEVDDSVVNKRIPFAFLVASGQDVKELKSAINIDGIHFIDAQVMDPAQFGNAAQEQPKAAVSAAHPAAAEAASKGIEVSTIRMDSRKLDILMNLSGELVIVKARFMQLVHQFEHELAANREDSTALDQIKSACDTINREVRELAGRSGAMGAKKLSTAAGAIDTSLLHIMEKNTRNTMSGMVHMLDEVTNSLEKISGDIQNGVMQARMVPVEGVFTRFKRIVRDISKSVGKEVVLNIEGEDTELDKKIVDSLNDPLTHLIRNAVDHGLEDGEGRAQAGKPKAGTITLRASHRGNSIWIEVSDDGRGMDPDKIAAVAVRKGVISQSDADKITPREKLNLIFLPGFSTAEKVTGLSGRGVGMDVVKTMAASVNGSVDIETVLGKGTTFILKIPLTLAIIKALLVKLGGGLYAFPLDSVLEILKVMPEEIYTVDGNSTIKLRDHALGIVDLERVLRIRGGAQRDSGARKVVLITDGNKRIGVVVDDLLGEEEIVIKSLTEHFSKVKGITGASILGDGRIALILDPVSIIDRAR